MTSNAASSPSQGSIARERADESPVSPAPRRSPPARSAGRPAAAAAPRARACCAAMAAKSVPIAAMPTVPSNDDRDDAAGQHRHIVDHREDRHATISSTAPMKTRLPSSLARIDRLGGPPGRAAGGPSSRAPVRRRTVRPRPSMLAKTKATQSAPGATAATVLHAQVEGEVEDDERQQREDAHRHPDLAGAQLAAQILPEDTGGLRTEAAQRDHRDHRAPLRAV